MYEKEWRNAEEHEAEDNDQLEQRKKEKCFIADVPKSQQMPLVLPSKDEPQFRRLLSKKARKSEAEASTSQESYQPQKMEVDELMDKVNVKREVLADKSDADIGITPTIKKSVAAGVTLKTLIADKDSSLMLFQLPTSISVTSDAIKSDDVSDQSTSQAGTSKHSLTGQKMQSKEAQRHCLDGFPTGVEIGKLQLLRSGRVVMKIETKSWMWLKQFQASVMKLLLELKLSPLKVNQMVLTEVISSVAFQTGFQSTIVRRLQILYKSLEKYLIHFVHLLIIVVGPGQNRRKIVDDNFG